MEQAGGQTADVPRRARRKTYRWRNGNLGRRVLFCVLLYDDTILQNMQELCLALRQLNEAPEVRPCDTSTILVIEDDDGLRSDSRPVRCADALTTQLPAAAENTVTGHLRGTANGSPSVRVYLRRRRIFDLLVWESGVMSGV